MKYEIERYGWKYIFEVHHDADKEQVENEILYHFGYKEIVKDRKNILVGYHMKGYDMDGNPTLSTIPVFIRDFRIYKGKEQINRFELMDLE